MAASTTTGTFISAKSGNASGLTQAAGVRLGRRRRITPEAGHALEILGHAIEYLTDEYVHEGGSLTGNDQRVQAVQLLMALNRQVYFECPEVPSFGERFRSILGLKAA
ncbi:MAG: hypothetical protein ABSG51_06040 [Terracidiphilus sp.]|jgi:hypothetical protein